MTYTSNKRTHRNEESNNNTTTNRPFGGMTPEEAGHKGGKAPHECRGMECETETEKGRNNKQ